MVKVRDADIRSVADQLIASCFYQFDRIEIVALSDRGGLNVMVGNYALSIPGSLPFHLTDSTGAIKCRLISCWKFVHDLLF